MQLSTSIEVRYIARMALICAYKIFHNIIKNAEDADGHSFQQLTKVKLLIKPALVQLKLYFRRYISKAAVCMLVDISSQL